MIGYWKYLLLCRKLTEDYLTPTLLITVAIYMILGNWEHVEGIYAFSFIAPMLCQIIKREDQKEAEVFGE